MTNKLSFAAVVVLVAGVVINVVAVTVVVMVVDVVVVFLAITGFSVGAAFPDCWTEDVRESLLEMKWMVTNAHPKC